MDIIIVSRHPAAIEFMASWLRSELVDAEVMPLGVHLFGRAGTEEAGQDYGVIPVVATATPANVLGKQVYGNLPLCLASLAHTVHAIEFDGMPPRGTEYTLTDMLVAHAVLRSYQVQAV